MGAINCVQGGFDKEFGVQILYEVICFPLLFGFILH